MEMSPQNYNNKKGHVLHVMLSFEFLFLVVDKWPISGRSSEADQLRLFWESGWNNLSSQASFGIVNLKRLRLSKAIVAEMNCAEKVNLYQIDIISNIPLKKKKYTGHKNMIHMTYL